jgi:tRNA nucleotidyltransferase/poly(A) polymerase
MGSEPILNPEAVSIIETLEKAGFETWAVGGGTSR